ncbi:hypothetical protein JTB14_011453 [Gonioctena quinquepunctata]|nr:hypothetical protein JTB14_011453 [Gonioctena quinquepunctata]
MHEEIFRHTEKRVIVKANGKSFADLLKSVKENMDINKVGVSIKNVSRTDKGDIMLEWYSTTAVRKNRDKKCCDKQSFIEDDADEAVSNKNINFVDKFQDTIDKLREKIEYLEKENYELKEKVKNDHTIIIPEMKSII